MSLFGENIGQLVRKIRLFKWTDEGNISEIKRKFEAREIMPDKTVEKLGYYFCYSTGKQLDDVIDVLGSIDTDKSTNLLGCWGAAYSERPDSEKYKSAIVGILAKRDGPAATEALEKMGTSGALVEVVNYERTRTGYSFETKSASNAIETAVSLYDKFAKAVANNEDKAAFKASLQDAVIDNFSDALLYLEKDGSVTLKNFAKTLESVSRSNLLKGSGLEAYFIEAVSIIRNSQNNMEIQLVNVEESLQWDVMNKRLFPLEYSRP